MHSVIAGFGLRFYEQQHDHSRRTPLISKRARELGHNLSKFRIDYRTLVRSGATFR